jgi:ribosomal protein S18 acetylase RimI-like enzyme
VASVVIRRARKTDANQVSAVFRHARAFMSYLPDIHTKEQIRRFFGRVLRQQQVHVAVVDDTVVGFAAVDDGWLHHLYVEPAWQGRRIGSTLLRTACDGLDRVQLWVFQENERARRFYESRGFTLEELTDGTGNEERRPDARYERVTPTAAHSLRL